MSLDESKPSEVAENPAAPAARSADSKINHAASISYWNSVASTSSEMLGMLGTYPWYTRIELLGSKTFLTKVRRLVPSLPQTGKLGLGVDCGAGVGRVTEGFLSHACKVVDAVEPVEKFTNVLAESKLKRDGVVGDIYTVGLENWHPQKKYDLIWVQWCVGHLTDTQLTEFIVRCRNSLTETGIMVIKENLSTDFQNQDMYDDLDSSVTRTDEKFKQLFAAARMDLIKSEIQTGFPKQFKLLPVKSYALRPNMKA
ncbi:Alpha N-terminal protein methyltransferase 1 [Penicillium malachiteum]|uniref:Alpha N-terminal protein methyltransferase 1 n=1 Tax=Penicillium malachiteum TaxID=1324776 RepID=A0AAD6HXL1_9EURO|nr:Alpha N-terminal protein methyltransferase 1 [Penicillium malachiteum]